jgi:translation initiation factor 2 beta subunit (eIF-2beta)/eIF-5
MAEKKEELGKTGQKCLVCYEELETKMWKGDLYYLKCPACGAKYLYSGGKLGRYA